MVRCGSSDGAVHRSPPANRLTFNKVSVQHLVWHHAAIGPCSRRRHEFIRDVVRPDLYGAPDRFDWSGGYSDAARALAATELRDWVNTRQSAGLDIFAHSHGPARR